MKKFPPHGEPWDTYRAMPIKELPLGVPLIPFPCTFEQLSWLCNAIHSRKRLLGWWRNLNGTEVLPEYLIRGFVAEVLFGLRFGLAPDFTLTEKGGSRGDGIDFILPLTGRTVDVKSIKPRKDLLREAGKTHADILVVYELDINRKGTCLGFIEDITVQLTPTWDTGMGVVNHKIARDFLRDIHELEVEEGINHMGHHIFPDSWSMPTLLELWEATPEYKRIKAMSTPEFYQWQIDKQRKELMPDGPG